MPGLHGSRHELLAGGALVLLGSATGAHAALLDAVSTSPDVTVDLDEAGGGSYADEDVAVDNLLGLVVPAGLGALPGASDVSGYEILASGDQLVCFDVTVELPGSVVAASGDVARYDGAAWSIELDASANGVPQGARCDAVTVDGSGNLVLSFDTTVSLPGGVRAADEDLVRVDGASSYTLLLDGDAAGIPAEADVDGAHLVPGFGLTAVSLDVSATVGGIDADDEDVLIFDPSGPSWTLLIAGSTRDADWGAADVDAIALPEPGFLVLLGSGLLALRILRRPLVE